MSFADAGRLVGYVAQAGDRVWVRWYDQSVKLPTFATATGPDQRYPRVGQTECIDLREADRLVEAVTGRKPRRKGRKVPADPTYEEKLRALKGDFPQSGAKVNSIVRKATVVHPMQARIMEVLDIIRDRGEVKHGGATMSETQAAVLQVWACKRRGIECEKEPIILVGRKRWHEGLIEDMEVLGVEYERVHA